MSGPNQLQAGKKASKYPPPISLRLTFEERTKLEQAATGMSLSAYIRTRLFGEDVSPRKKRHKSRIKDHEVLSQLLGALGQSRIANNLNQLAKAVNMGTLPVTPDVEKDIQEACSHIRRMRTALMNALHYREDGS